ncbi:MAG TPA: LLM class F420-dependent oxidoreductase, partial [Ktedonobacterales bacterium]
LTPEGFSERSQLLDELLPGQMRQPDEVRRTMMTTLYFGRDMEELDRRLSWRLHVPELVDRQLIDVLESLHGAGRAIAGTPDMVIKQIRAYEDAGVQELMLQWFDMDDIDGLHAFAESVLPQVQ